MDHLKMYNICGLDVLAEFRYPRMQQLAEKYRCDFQGEPRLILPFNEEKFEYYHGRYPRMSEENCEVMSSAFSFYRALLGFGGFFLHSSAVVVDGRVENEKRRETPLKDGAEAVLTGDLGFENFDRDSARFPPNNQIVDKTG